MLATPGFGSRYDFIVCGSGSSGSVIARRLAEHPQVRVLLLEAGGSDDVPQVMDPLQWPVNLGSERDWGFTSEPSTAVNGRSILLSMGKVLGGGSSINVMAWARGHKNDWDHFAAESGDKGWGHQSVLDIYRRIEDWHGNPDPAHRGVGGPVYVQTAPRPHPVACAVLAAAESLGIPSYASHNGAMMERGGGASILDFIVRDGRRQSMFRSYVAPYLDRPNLTVLTEALVTKVVFDGDRATGVQFTHGGTLHTVSAGSEVILSLGAIHTPKVLMQSGVGAADELTGFGIPVVADLPGVGKNYQDHPRFDCVWEFDRPVPPRNNGAEATLFWKSDPAVGTPDLQICLAEVPLSSPENAAKYALPEHGWSLLAGVLHPKSRGRISLTGADPGDPVRVEANMLSHPDDVKAAVAGVQLCRQIGNAAQLRHFTKREVTPGNLTDAGLVDFIRNAAMSYYHHSGTAKMGTDDMSVVDGTLKVRGIERLRVADASIMPRVTTGNTMAPCVVIGERAADLLKDEHRL
jgi:choline dehydrogenase